MGCDVMIGLWAFRSKAVAAEYMGRSFLRTDMNLSPSLTGQSVAFPLKNSHETPKIPLVFGTSVWVIKTAKYFWLPAPRLNRLLGRRKLQSFGKSEETRVEHPYRQQHDCHAGNPIA
jgi:hypothetical protein